MAKESAFEQLDPLLQHRVRFAVCVLLSKGEQLSFSYLKKTLRATDGNLGAQLTKLESKGYLKVNKFFENRKPLTTYSLTPKGRSDLQKHLRALQRIIDLGDRKPSDD